MNELKIHRTHALVPMPKFATSQSACFDLSFCCAGKHEYKGYNLTNSVFNRPYSTASITIMPGDRIMVPTGLIMDIPEGYSVRLHARSGTSLKQGLVLVNAEGVIDADYIEEVFVLITNTSDAPAVINNGDRIAQAELVKTEDYVIVEAPSKPLPKTNRIGGMGSTGTESFITIKTDASQFIKASENIEVPEKRGRGRPRKVAI